MTPSETQEPQPNPIPEIDREPYPCATCGLETLPCPTCGSRMPAVFRFCGRCGTDLNNGCPRCNQGLPPGLDFCGHCGVSLRDDTATDQPAETPAALGARDLELLGEASALDPTFPQRPLLPEEQLRRVAIVFVDLAGSTSLSERLEPEHAYRLVSECVSGLGAVITEFGGYVVKTLGDGLMALFGAPVAHGDDPERAARAALRMQSWMRDHSARMKQEFGATLRIRVGINFGSVVAAPVSAGGRPEYDVLGDAVNVAQRLEAAAEPGTVCVSESFYRLTRSEFEYHSRGMARVKGKSEPLALYRLVRPRPTETKGLRTFPLVGREKVLRTLHGLARSLSEGQGSYLVLTGGPGLGKSRLLEELAGDLGAFGIPVLRGQGVDGEKDGPLALWRGWLADLLAIHPRMAHHEAAEQIRSTFLQPEHENWAEWLAALVVDPKRLLALEPEDRERTVRGAISVFLQHWQQSAPGALLIDDVDLLDSASMSLLAAVAAEPTSGPLLVALTGRVSPGHLPPAAQVVTLRPLSALAARKLIASSLPDGVLSPEATSQLAERAGGNPLFLTLMLQAAAESADPAQMFASVPDSVYGLIQAQIDRLSREERVAAHAASILGRSFAERWLASLCGMDVDASGAGRETWQTLEHRGVLEEQRPAPERDLAFRHGAWQEVLYEGLLRAQRRQLHERAAAIFSREGGQRADLAARAAWHWRCAEKWDEALSWTLKAAEHASALYARDEAESTYRQCLVLAERLGRPAASARAEAGLAELAEHQGEFGAALHHFYLAERHLGGQDPGGSSPDPELRALRCRVKLGSARVQARTGALTAAQPLLETVLQLLDESSDSQGRRIFVQALTEQAHVLRDLGQLHEAERSARRALKLAEDESWNQEAAQAASALGRIYPLLGNWPAAEGVLRRAAQLAEVSGNWREAAGCWINLSSGLQGAGRLREAAAALDHALEQARRIGDAEKMAIIRMNLGTVHLNRGDWKAAEESYRAALEQFQAMEHRLGIAFSLYNLTETLRWAARFQEARELLRAAEASLEQVDAPQLRPHLLLSEAELLLAVGDGRGAAARATDARTAAEELGYESGINLARLTLGRALLTCRDLTGAERNLEAAVQGFEHMDQPLEEARARGELAAVEQARGRTARARELHQQAVEIIRRLEARPWLDHLPRLGA